VASSVTVLDYPVARAGKPWFRLLTGIEVARLSPPAKGYILGMLKFLRLSVLGLAAYGAYTLWTRYGGTLGLTSRNHDSTTDRRISARAELTVEEVALGSDDPVAQAAAILADSDDRARLPRDAPGIEHRRSQDTVEL
jgi:hypothetical protein